MSSERSQLSGSLAAVSLPGLLQLLAVEERSGRLVVEAADGAGRSGSLWLVRGRVVHAQHDDGEQSDAEVAMRLLDVSVGDFRFESEAEPPERSLDLAAGHLLLEAARRRDHAERGELPDEVEVTPATVPALVAEPPGGSSPRFDTLQWRLLAAVDGRRSVSEMAAVAGVPLQAAAEVVDDLIRSGVLDVGAASSSEP